MRVVTLLYKLYPLADWPVAFVTYFGAQRVAICSNSNITPFSLSQRAILSSI